MSDDEKPPSPREALNGTVWDILRGAYVRAASGGRIPREQADRNELCRPFLADMKADYQALLACMDRAGVITYQEVSAVAPGPPELDETG